MKKYIDDLITAMIFAWEELIDLPLPKSFKKQSECDEKNMFLLASFPLLGFIIGALTALLSDAVSAIFNYQSGGVVFALIAWSILCFKDSGRSDSWLAGAILRKLQDHENSDFTRNTLTIFPVLLKFVILLFLGLWCDRSYFAMLLAGGFALQAALASSENCSTQFIRFDERGIIAFRITSVAIGIIGFIFCSMGTIGAIAVVCGLFIVCNKKLSEDGFSADSISRAGYLAEWALLFTGLLLMRF